MKKLGSLKINTEKLIKNEDLITLRGGYGQYSCYREGWIPGCYGFIASYNTFGCDAAWDICRSYGGWCVIGPGC